MPNLSDDKMKFPWLKVGIVALILIIVSGIYVLKNSAAADKGNKIAPINTTIQSNKVLEQKTTDSNTSTEKPSSEQTSSVKPTEQTSSSEQKSQEAKKALPKLVDLGSDTCIPCKEMGPILEELKNEYKDKVEVEVVDFYKDRAKALEYHAKHPIRVIPTQILYDASGKEVWSNEGSLAKEELIIVFKEKVGVK